MKRTFFKRWMVIGFILIFQAPFLSSADENPYPKILDAAQEGIRIFLKNSRAVDLFPFGFSSQGEVDEAVLGEGFQVFTVLPDSLLREGDSQDLTSLAVSTNIWQFVIKAGEKPKTLLTVELVNGQWTPVSIGASGLANQLGKLLEAWPVSAGYKYRLIRVYQAKSDVIEISMGETAMGFIPLTSARVAMGVENREFNPLDIYPSEDVAVKIRPAVRENIRRGF